MSKIDRRTAIDTELIDIGFNVKLLGFTYIGDGLDAMFDTGLLSSRSVRWIYAYIWERRRKSFASIERAIRTAIEDCWLHGDPEKLADLFSRCTDTGRPSNLEFFNLMCRKICRRIDTFRNVK